MEYAVWQEKLIKKKIQIEQKIEEMNKFIGLKFSIYKPILYVFEIFN